MVEDSNDPLSRTLTGLVGEGLLTDAQAGAVRSAYDRELSSSAGAERAVGARTQSGASARVPEVLGYLGGTFVVAAALLVLGWSWSDFSYSSQVLVASVCTAAVLAAGLGIALSAPGPVARLRTPEQDVRRRLVGVLLTVAAFTAAGTVGLVIDHLDWEGSLLPIALVALVVMLCAVWLAPGIVPTFGLFIATCMLFATPGDLADDVDTLVWVLIFLALGLLWVTGGPRVTRTSQAALALGLGTLVVTGWIAAAHTIYEPSPYDAPSYVAELEWGERLIAPLGLAVLAGVAVVGVTLYLRGQAWPWLAAATGAAAGLVFEVAGDAFGPAIASLVTGVVLLGASGILLIRRNRPAVS